jgi:hypothetical protein
MWLPDPSLTQPCDRTAHRHYSLAGNLLQKLRESVIDGNLGDSSWRHPWARSSKGLRGNGRGPDLMRALSDEIARMTAALERLRELHKRGEVLDLRGDVDAGRK